MSKNRHHFSSSSKLQFLLMAQSFAKFKENSSFIGEISQSQVIDDLRPPPALILLCSSVAAHQTWIFKSLSVANDRSFSYSDSVAQFQWIPIQYLFISTSSPVSIPHNCYGHHGRCPCKNILSGLKFSRLNAKTA